MHPQSSSPILLSFRIPPALTFPHYRPAQVEYFLRHIGVSSDCCFNHAIAVPQNNATCESGNPAMAAQSGPQRDDRLHQGQDTRATMSFRALRLMAAAASTAVAVFLTHAVYAQNAEPKPGGQRQQAEEGQKKVD